MYNFNYYTPTKVVFGKNTELKVADLIREFGGTKVLIHYGGGSVIRSGLMQRVTDTLDAACCGNAVSDDNISAHCYSLPFLIDYCIVRASCHAGRLTAAVFKAQLALLRHARWPRSDCAVGTHQHAGQTADTLSLIYLHNAFINAYRTSDTAFYAKRIFTVTAGYRIGYIVRLLDVHTGIDRLILERFDHIGKSRVCKGTVVLAKVTAKTPLFIDIYSFHL